VNYLIGIGLVAFWLLVLILAKALHKIMGEKDAG